MSRNVNPGDRFRRVAQICKAKVTVPARTGQSLGLFAGVLLMLALPWQTKVSVPAIERASQYVTLFSPVPAQITAKDVVPGKPVKAGDVLFRLEAPELDYKLAVRLPAVTCPTSWSSLPPRRRSTMPRPS